MGTRAERDRLLGTKQIRYKVVLCSSGSTANILTFYGAQRGVWERTDTCTCVAESLQRPPETVTVLSIHYTSVKSKQFKFKNIKSLCSATETDMKL